MTNNEFDDVIVRLRAATRYAATEIPDDLPTRDVLFTAPLQRSRPIQHRRVWIAGAVGVVAAATVGAVFVFDDAPPNARARLVAAISRATAANTARISIIYTVGGIPAPPDQGVVNFADQSAEASTPEGLTNIRIGDQEWYTTLPLGSAQPWTHEFVPPAMSFSAAGNTGTTGTTGSSDTTGTSGSTGTTSAPTSTGSGGGTSCSIFNFGTNTSATVLLEASQADQSQVTEIQPDQYAVNLQDGATATFTITDNVLSSVTVVLSRFAGPGGGVKGSATYQYSDYGVPADIVPPTADTPPLRQSYANGVTAPESGTGNSGSTATTETTGTTADSGNSGSAS